MAPIDMAYTKMLNDIVLLIVGGIGGVIGKKGVGSALNAIQGSPTPPPVQPSPPPVQAPVATSTWTPTSSAPNWLNFKNPDLDESWTPPPPPTTPPDHMEDNAEREHMAMARKEVE